jgi:hypothetical protein
MVNLDKIAEDNLDVLCGLKSHNINYNRLTLKSVETESESIVDLSEIDSQIYFTFHQCLLKLRKENKFGSRYDSRKQLQDKMEIALNNLYTQFTIQDSSLLSDILLDIDELLETTYHEYSYSLLKPVNHVVRYVLHPIYEVVDDLYQRYRLYYNAYHYIVYHQRLDILDKVLNECQSDSDSESDSSVDVSEEVQDGWTFWTLFSKKDA